MLIVTNYIIVCYENDTKPEFLHSKNLDKDIQGHHHDICFTTIEAKLPLKLI